MATGVGSWAERQVEPLAAGLPSLTTIMPINLFAIFPEPAASLRVES